jgi:hypothetical protein
MLRVAGRCRVFDCAAALVSWRKVDESWMLVTIEIMLFVAGEKHS